MHTIINTGLSWNLRFGQALPTPTTHQPQSAEEESLKNLRIMLNLYTRNLKSEEIHFLHKHQNQDTEAQEDSWKAQKNCQTSHIINE
ncbi:hypothetical protein NQZ68_007953 [Dissostichus eleginoides]|nr:hypothetical protein NQZ68_007953 [Dissostichus eleginoides]